MAMSMQSDCSLPRLSIKSVRMSVFTTLLCIVLFLSCITGDIPRPRGVSISKATYYQVSSQFTCIDGSGVIPYNQVNDDYCDCPDASDEPGTSACPNGSFHCTNSGHRPENIPSSRVDDGICDCCDGTDEYESKLCVNTCRELGRAAREEGERQRLLMEEGHKTYLEYCIAGQEAVKEKMARKEQLEQEKTALKTTRDKLEAVKNEAETPEREAKDRHQQDWEEKKKVLEEEKHKASSMQAFLQLDSDGNSMVSVTEMQEHQEYDIDANGEVSVEEAKEYLEDRNEVDAEFFRVEVWPNIREIYAAPPSPSTDEDFIPPPVEEAPPTPTPDDEHYYDEEEDDEDYDDEEPPPFPRGDEDLDDDYSDDYDGGYESTDTDGDKKVDPQMPEYDEETKKLIAVANLARDEFNEAEKKYKDVEREYNDVDKFLGLDFGPNQEFHSLKDQCYEFTDLQYIYKMCAFEKTTQRAKSGGSDVNLGRWGQWDGPSDKLYSAMKYEKGQNCWNGPDRSTRVIISCGTTNQIVSASEPNRCEYEFQFLSPAACAKSALPVASHDEL